MGSIFSKTIHIHAPAEKVWLVLTDPQWMKQWMSDAEIEVSADWKEGGVMFMRGKLHGRNFENKGTLLEFVPGKKLAYNCWSRLLGLPDKPGHYTRISFTLNVADKGTELVFSQEYATVYEHDRHAELYWNVTLGMIKKLVEDHVTGM